MLTLTSDIEGKGAFYGDIHGHFEKAGFHMNGGWEYDFAMFDSILYQKGGATIYLRLPARVLQGKLDHPDAYLRFGTPFLIKHVVHTGFVEEDFKALDLVGLNQFQAPLDPDDQIEHESKWREAGERALQTIKQFVHSPAPSNKRA